ncbi:MAG: exo-alpha-sialidase [Clostridia bacterium]|nr:exo-alpha-sialidase [Clostridia bacterium]
MEFKTIFGPGTGGPSDYYRIPSMITTKSGVVVACADARFFTGADNPNRIDKVVRRSHDSGETWEDYMTVVEEFGTEKMLSSAAIDPILTYNEETNRIFMHYCHTPAGVGILNCNSTVGEDAEGNKIIKKGIKKYILKDGKLYTKSGKPTEYTVSENGEVSDGKTSYGSIFTGGKFTEAHTASLMMCYSDDDGLTWSEPVSLNSQVKKGFMSFIGPGPGAGITVKHGKYKGRVVVPIYYGVRKFPLGLSCCVIYSDDNGASWTLGETPNNTRKIFGFKGNHYLIIEHNMLTESQVIEQSDGTLKYFMRNHDPKRCVAIAYSKNGGASWENFSHDENLPQPICQNSVIKIENADKPYVVFLNAADKKERKCGTVRLSEDDGETFPYSRVLKEDSFVYSSMTLLPDGNIGVLFEPDLECQNIWFTKFSLDWIKGKE